MKPRDRNTDAAGQPLNQPPEVDILDRGRANNCLADPILKLWIQANAAPFYAISLFWFRDYFLDLHHPNVQFKYQKLFDPRHPHRRLPVFYFRRLSLMTQIQVATIAIIWCTSRSPTLWSRERVLVTVYTLGRRKVFKHRNADRSVLFCDVELSELKAYHLSSFLYVDGHNCSFWPVWESGRS